MVVTLGKMDPNTRATGTKTKFMELVSTNGLMVASTMASGLITTCMAMVYTLGKTDVATRVNILRIESMAKVSIDGQMEESMTDNGRTGDSTVKVCTGSMKQPHRVEVYGLKANGKDGLTPRSETKKRF